ncbi:MAG: Fic family protein [bacterium]
MISIKITDEIIRQLKQVSDLAADRRVYVDSVSAECREAMHRYARISTIGATTRIENAILTDVEVDWLDKTLSADGRTTAFIQKKRFIENKLSKERERSIEEVAGCRNMLEIIFHQAKDLFPLTEAAIRGLHSELLHFYPPAVHYLGKYKVAPNNVVEMVVGTDIRMDVLKTADPGPITSAAMTDLVEWYNGTLPEYPWCLAVAAEFVFRFLAIHPFQDGNGRIGRALFTLAVLQSDDRNLSAVIPCIALDRHIEKHKEEYYLVLQKCSEGKFMQDPKKYRMEYFLMFYLKMIEEALKHDIAFYAKRYEAIVKLAAAPRKVLQCFKEHPERKLSTKDIIEYTGLPRRTAIHALNVLLKDEFLQRYGKGAGTIYQLTF